MTGSRFAVIEFTRKSIGGSGNGRRPRAFLIAVRILSHTLVPRSAAPSTALERLDEFVREGCVKVVGDREPPTILPQHASGRDLPVQHGDRLPIPAEDRRLDLREQAREVRLGFVDTHPNHGLIVADSAGFGNRTALPASSWDGSAPPLCCVGRRAVRCSFGAVVERLERDLIAVTPPQRRED